MNDRWSQTIPANTAEASAVTVECNISPGLLTKLIIYFPAGCQGLCRCRVLLGEKPIAPRSPKKYLAGEDMPIVLDQINELITENIPVLKWILWNVDETYSHTPWLIAEWISEDEPIAMKSYRMLKDLVALMRALFRR